MRQDISFPSRMIGGIHQKLLLVAVIISIIMIGMNVVYAFNYDWYYEEVYKWDEAAIVFLQVLNFILIVTYLIWLTRVHQAMRLKFKNYPITPIMGLVRMIPLVHLWGIIDTYLRLSLFFRKIPELEKRGRLVKGTLIIMFSLLLIVPSLNSFLTKSDPNDVWMPISYMADSLLIISYYVMTKLVSSTLALLFVSPESEGFDYNPAYEAALAYNRQQYVQDNSSR
ncbi:hypothetical protein D3C74_53070 [compost metagenome]